MTYENVNCSYMRTRFKLGAPLLFNGTRYKDKTDREKDQEKIVSDWILQFENKVKIYLKDDKSGFDMST